MAVEEPVEAQAPRALAAAALRMAAEPATLVIPLPAEDASEELEALSVEQAAPAIEPEAIRELAEAVAGADGALEHLVVRTVEEPIAQAEAEAAAPVALVETVTEASVDSEASSTAGFDAKAEAEVEADAVIASVESPALTIENAAPPRDSAPDVVPPAVVIKETAVAVAPEAPVVPVETSVSTAELIPRTRVAPTPVPPAPGAAPQIGLLRRMWMAIVNFFRSIFGL